MYFENRFARFVDELEGDISGMIEGSCAGFLRNCMKRGAI